MVKPLQYEILIDGNSAGIVELYLDLSEQRASRETLIWGLIALSVLLSSAVYALTKPMGQRLARNISDAVAQLDAVTEDASASVNEVHKLKDRINALPLDLLTSQDITDRSEEHYHETAILCISLKTPSRLPRDARRVAPAKLRGNAPPYGIWQRRILRG